MHDALPVTAHARMRTAMVNGDASVVHVMGVTVTVRDRALESRAWVGNTVEKSSFCKTIDRFEANNHPLA